PFNSASALILPLFDPLSEKQEIRNMDKTKLNICIFFIILFCFKLWWPLKNKSSRLSNFSKLEFTIVNERFEKFE
ncbi:MAG: hypothetical protein DRJ10_11025, partial [Bacteroidetes bacterium]